MMLGLDMEAALSILGRYNLQLGFAQAAVLPHVNFFLSRQIVYRVVESPKGSSAADYHPTVGDDWLSARLIAVHLHNQ